MQNRMMGAALLCLALAASPVAMAAGKKDKAVKKASEPAAVVADVAPPSGSWEAAPPPNKDYVWSKGYYAWKDDRYQWTAGQWVLKEEGREYEQHKWVQRPDGKYELTGGKFVSAAEAKKDGVADDARASSKDARSGDAKKTSDTGSMGAAPVAKP
ncbi:MAG: hypothetical protein NVS2B4_13590 [Ramlibacter sp.]